MKVRCLYNNGDALRKYENRDLESKTLGRFGSTSKSEYNEIKIGQEYLVMGIITFQFYQGYLIDSGGFISICPCYLFEITDSRVNSSWSYRVIDKEENIYPYVQSILGYSELSEDKNSYENLIVEKTQEARKIYFSRKNDVEKMEINSFEDK